MNALFIAVFGVFFIIGACTLLLGCNPQYRGQCIAYDLIDGVVYGYKFETDTCSRCTSKDTEGNCTNTEYYSCYHSYLRLRYHHNHTCLYETVHGARLEERAHNGAVKHAIGSHMQAIKRKTSPECMSPNIGLDTWITGVVFLSLCVAMLVVAVALSVWEEYNNRLCYYDSYWNGCLRVWNRRVTPAVDEGGAWQQGVQMTHHLGVNQHRVPDYSSLDGEEKTCSSD